MISKIFSQFLLILAARNSVTTPKPGEIPWPFLDDQLMIRNLMLISEHLPNLPNFEAHSLFVGPIAGPIPVLVNVASGITGASVASLPLRLVPVPPARRSCRTYSPGGIAGREDVVFCDLLSKKTYKISYNIIYQQMSKIYFTIIHIDKQPNNQLEIARV